MKKNTSKAGCLLIGVYLYVCFAFLGTGSVFAKGGQISSQEPSSIKHQVVVTDEESRTIPYIHALFDRTGQYILSDESGVLSFSEEELSLGGYLVFESAFYKEKRIPVDSLPYLDKIVLESPLLDEVVVYPKGYLAKEIGKVADYFSKHYATDYVATVTTLYTVECNGKYREFMGYQGLFGSFHFTQQAPSIYFKDKNFMSRILPLTTMRSDRLRADSDELLEPDFVPSEEISYREPKSLKITYEDTRTNVRPLYMKRALEIYSPLNARQIKNFDYRRQPGYSLPEGKVIVVKFRTREGVFPRKTKLYGEGEIHYLKDSYRIVRVVSENIQDLYSVTPRLGAKDLLPSATSYTLTVDYSQSGGKLYTKSVSSRIAWVDLKFSEGDFYRITYHPRRNPGKHHTKEYFYAAFSDVVYPTGEKLESLQKVIAGNGGAEYIHFFYAPFEKAHWESLAMPGIDKDKLFRDLEVNGRSLYQQARENGMKKIDGHLTFDYPEKSRNVYRVVRNDLYPYIYEKEYK